MCGIAGTHFWNADIDRMLDSLAHRGPDGRGTVGTYDTVLGHVRLAIQDPSPLAGQPFHVPGGTWLVYNGEAWNPQWLREMSGNTRWFTDSDTEPVAHLLDQRGYEALNLIDGMFAMAWNDGSGTWLARDRWGKIPLYYAEPAPGSFVFASEIKALAVVGVHTGVKAVRPGTAMCLDTGKVVEWAMPIEPEEPDPERVLSLLRSGVHQRLLSDWPVCFLLSGGLDSSLVLRLARDLHPNPVAYTAVLDPDSADLKMARRVASWLDVPLVEVPVPSPDHRSMAEAVCTIEVPMKAQVEIALAHLPLTKRIAEDGFRVVLSGEAADELFCGYGSMAIRASHAGDDDGYRAVIRSAVDKMARGNFLRVNKVMMRYGVEGRLPYMEERLVAMLLGASKEQNPPGKRLLKAAAASVLPRDVVNRAKETFQGGTGLSRATALLWPSPTKAYNEVARGAFGFLPRE